MDIKIKAPLFSEAFFICRDDKIRTCDHQTPSLVRYRTALRPELKNIHPSLDLCGEQK